MAILDPNATQFDALANRYEMKVVAEITFAEWGRVVHQLRCGRSGDGFDLRE